MSNNGPHYTSREMKEFVSSYGFTHITSNPHYLQSNGQAERAVKSVKALIEHSPYMALLSYRATPFPWCGLSPTELHMGQRLRTDIPQIEKSLVPKIGLTQNFENLDWQQKERQKQAYDKQQRVQDAPALQNKQAVWVEHKNMLFPGEVMDQAEAPRSYRMETGLGQL